MPIEIKNNTKEHAIKTARIELSEIRQIGQFLSELAEYKNEIDSEFEPSDLDKYSVLKNLKEQDPEDFIYNICAHVDALPIRKLTTNCYTLLENCADMNENLLEFNNDIKKAFNALEELEVTKKAFKELYEAVDSNIALTHGLLAKCSNLLK